VPSSPSAWCCTSFPKESSPILFCSKGGLLRASGQQRFPGDALAKLEVELELAEKPQPTAARKYRPRQMVRGGARSSSLLKNTTPAISALGCVVVLFIHATSVRPESIASERCSEASVKFPDALHKRLLNDCCGSRPTSECQQAERPQASVQQPVAARAASGG
jgi:hypothetical protein